MPRIEEETDAEYLDRLCDMNASYAEDHLSPDEYDVCHEEV
jgi:hypothetical protein